MFVMDLMRPPDGPEIGVVGASQEAEALVDKDIMDHEIGHSIAADAEADVK